MKVIINALALTLLLTTSASFAQSGNTSNDPRVANVTREMSAKLSLNESDYIKLKSLNQEKFSKATEINAMYANDANMRTSKIAELQNSYDSKLKAFLTPAQLDAYATYKTNSTNFTALSEGATK